MAAVRAVAAGQPGGASLAPLTHLSAAPAPTQPQLSQLQLTALARRNNCFARGETSGPGRVSAAAPGPASDVMADVTRAGENYTGAITGQAAHTRLTLASHPGERGLNIVNTLNTLNTQYTG